jgi:uncharacterized protein YajQ (UPF0234 family)
MPSFDLVSKVDTNELKNAVEMAKKIIIGRYDFKGSNAEIQWHDDYLELRAEDEYKVKTILDILREQMVKRKLGLNNTQAEDIVTSGKNMLKQKVVIKQGLDKEMAKTINKIIKTSPLKIQSSIIDDKLRLESKKIDDLQSIFQFLKNHKEITVDLQMENIKR